MADDTDQAIETSTPTTEASRVTEAPEFETSSRSDPTESADDKKRSSLNKLIKAEFDKAKKEPSPARQEAAAKRAREQETGKFAAEPKDKTQPTSAKVEQQPIKNGAAPDASQAPKQETPSDPAQALQSPAVAPASLSKETKALWDTLPDAVRQDIIKREGDTAKGIEQLRTRYQQIDDAIAPVMPLLQQVRKTPAEAITQLFAWHRALGNPDKNQARHALAQLAQSHGIDLATVAPNSGQQPQAQDPNDPRLQLQQALHGTVSPLDQRLSALEQQLVRSQQAAVQQDIASFSKDKPHFDRVRMAMGQMMASGYATSLDDAYNKATWADPDIRADILAQEQAKREAEAKAAQEAQAAKAAAAEAERKEKERIALDKARKASVSPRGSTPMGSAVPKQVGGKSVKDSILEARRQHQGGSI